MIFFSPQPFRSYFSHGMISSHITDNRYYSLFPVKRCFFSMWMSYFYISAIRTLYNASFGDHPIILHLIFAHLKTNKHAEAVLWGMLQIFVGFNSVGITYTISMFETIHIVFSNVINFFMDRYQNFAQDSFVWKIGSSVYDNQINENMKVEGVGMLFCVTKNKSSVFYWKQGS